MKRTGLRIKIVTILIFCVVGVLVNAAEFKLKSLVDNREKLWDSSPDQFIGKCGWKTFKWNSAKKEALYYSAGKESKLQIGKTPILEVVARFKLDKLQQIEISIYNRGDAGEIKLKAFKYKLDDVITLLNEIFSYRLSPERSRQQIAGRLITSSIWKSNSVSAKLRWSISRAGRRSLPEFISLTLFPADIAPPTSKASVNRDNLPNRVKQDKDGCRYIELPMVDQGAKGYCVVAVLERVMKYYGSDVDQHLLAELVESSAIYGTGLKQMSSALRDADAKLGVKFKKLYENRSIVNYSKFMRMLRYYNRTARKAGKERLDTKLFCTTKGKNITYDPMAFLSSVDPEVFADMRMKYYKSDANRFFRDVERYITLGIPVVWSVQLGIFAEKNAPQAKGGHMRLITGFNRKDKIICFSDSWGAGHELKKMPYRQAWAITSGLYLLPPRFKRKY